MEPLRFIWCRAIAFILAVPIRIFSTIFRSVRSSKLVADSNLRIHEAAEEASHRNTVSQTSKFNFVCHKKPVTNDDDCTDEEWFIPPEYDMSPQTACVDVATGSSNDSQSQCKVDEQSAMRQRKSTHEQTVIHVPTTDKKLLTPSSRLQLANANGNTLCSLRSFELMELIGVGSFAHVYRAQVVRNGQPVALKLVRKNAIETANDLAYLRGEMLVLQVASGCTFLCELFAAFNAPRCVCFVLPLAACDLLRLLELRGGALHEEEARFYIAQIVLALEYLHRKAILYRDLKPDNALVGLDGYVKLGDFGMCKLFSEADCKPVTRKSTAELYRTRTFCGSLTYMAPETLCGEPYSFSCDYWSLGVLLFELLTARSPFAFVSINLNLTSAPAKPKKKLKNGSHSGSIHLRDAQLIERCKQQNAELVSAILEKPVHTPRTVSVHAGSFVKALLQKTPQKRLGCVARDGRYVQLGPTNLQTGLDETSRLLKAHTFFRSLNWNALENHSLEPPALCVSLARQSRATAAADADMRLDEQDLHLSSPVPTGVADQYDFSSFDFLNQNFCK